MNFISIFRNPASQQMLDHAEAERKQFIASVEMPTQREKELERRREYAIQQIGDKYVFSAKKRAELTMVARQRKGVRT